MDSNLTTLTTVPVSASRPTCAQPTFGTDDLDPVACRKELGAVARYVSDRIALLHGSHQPSLTADDRQLATVHDKQHLAKLALLEEDITLSVLLQDRDLGVGQHLVVVEVGEKIDLRQPVADRRDFVLCPRVRIAPKGLVCGMNLKVGHELHKVFPLTEPGWKSSALLKLLLNRRNLLLRVGPCSREVSLAPVGGSAGTTTGSSAAILEESTPVLGSEARLRDVRLM